MSSIACACGCGQLFPRLDTYGRPRRYVHGHNSGTRDIRERFRKLVDVRQADECWPWTGRTNNKGYGFLEVKIGGGAKRKVLAHRISFEIHQGAIASDNEILHRCDNPPCCNPAHLSQGTRTDNMRDAASKLRICGERASSAKFTEASVVQIRHAAENGEGRQDLADKYSVAITTISSVVQRRTWRHVS
jgi:hypothetical protein